ncbi:thymidylate kinase [Methanocaldococcus vulcanius M7]|uniref:Probable thymidylate kinase n=1 Tax=Methanocaldococcus vulcanius (strain ATCC 700851 / DSM 12094 / M7) TaxID=579137 RepID=C9RH19_METVM|nr:dTMP kinase [Methanocaldococcus vulcanius]ACX72871.1 thymidylate kinase [Methanocaldococcus vulcanius M7]
MFIVFEGIDGSGKTTISKKLAKSINAFWTYEPSNSVVGELIRKILSGNVKVDDKTLALLFSADRIEHNKKIKEELRYRDVVCDRYLYSSIAYQSVAGVDEDFIRSINRYALKPDLVFLLICDIETALKRINTKDIFEKKEFLEKVQEKYLDLAKKEGFVIIDTTDRTVEDVYSEVFKTVKLRSNYGF